METAKFYTRTRRVPVLIGTFSTIFGEKKRIPYGPYTIVQLVGVAAVIWLLSKTTAVWARGGLTLSFILAVGAVGGTVYLLGKVPHTGRNPLSVAAAAISVLTGPAGGTRKGRPVRVRRPHRARVMAVFPVVPAAPKQARSSVADPPPSRPPVPPGPVEPALTAVGRLLAAAPTSTRSEGTR